MPTKSPAPRFTFVDALRGLAALWVACFHFYEGVSNHYQSKPFPEPFPTLLRLGDCGVDVFFVLSGFVIAFSIREAKITLGYFGNFVLRRSARLEPPYWVTIALTIAAVQFANLVRDDRYVPLPSWQQLLAHVFYLQDILGYGQILTVFWTLCFEVQFYLTFVGLCGLAGWLGGWMRLGDAGGLRLRLLVFVPLTAWSLAARALALKWPHGFAVEGWSLFYLGVLIWWALQGECEAWHFWALAATILAATAWRPSPHGVIGVAAGLALYAAGRMDGLGTWLAHPVLQYLGRISYSLYLTHNVIGGPFAYYFRARLFGPEPGVLPAVGLFTAAVAVSIVAAHLMYLVVERPSVELAKWLKQKEPAQEPPPPESDPAPVAARSTP